MNRFLKKKGPPERLPTIPLPEELPAVTSPTGGRPVSPGRKSSSSRWRRNKKPLPEQRPQIDLTAALPSNDDFRTSLLMPNLSARFSMLREQDDPKSKLGKASDDSVLQPRRRSRLVDFGNFAGQLGDIAEVASLNGSIRPPFTGSDRQPSFTSEDGYSSEVDSTASFMKRARRGEGNNLFGGRQKVYMIPASGASSSRSIGRAVYEDDVLNTAFSRRARAREADEARRSDDGAPAEDNQEEHAQADVEDKPMEEQQLLHSPSASSFDKKRSTTSTSHSDARSSYTIATSVASQPSNASPSSAAQTVPAVGVGATTASATQKRSDSKPRRLYEQGLDQHLYEQQTSALTRLNSIQRQRNPTGRMTTQQRLHGSKSAGNLHEKHNHPVYALPLQNPLPPLAPLASFGSVRKPQPNTASPDLSRSQSPAGELGESEVLNQALEPGDRGKATAMGAFAKPQQAFDEEQYMQRQRQLQRSNSNTAMLSGPSSRSNSQTRPPRPEYARDRTGSDASVSARSRSRPRIETTGAGPSGLSNGAQEPVIAQPSTSASGGRPSHDKASYLDTHRTFFGDISASDSDDEEPSAREHPLGQPDYGYGTHHGRWQPTILPSVSEHPALRSAKSKASLAEEEEDTWSKSQRLQTLTHKPTLDAERLTPRDSPLDSPTVVPAMPLNGMMKHLRQPSDKSSVYQPEGAGEEDEDIPRMPEWNPKDLDLVNRHIRQPVISDSRLRTSDTESNLWDLDDSSATNTTVSTTNDGSATEHRRGAHLIHPAERRPREYTGPQPVNDQCRESDASQASEDNGDSSWQAELRKQHTRGASTETQQERDAFADELAARRQAIQQNIKSMVDNQKRAASPGRPAGLKSMLRPKPSREGMPEVARPAGMPPKAIKTLGAGAAPSAAPAVGQPNGRAYTLDATKLRENPATRAPTHGLPRSIRSEQDMRRVRDNNQSTDAPPQLQYARSNAPSPSGNTRSRAGSEAAGSRSRSRTGGRRDDVDKAAMENALPPALTASLEKDWTPQGSPDVTSHHLDIDVSRDASSEYFDRKALHPIHTNVADRSPGTGVSPMTLSAHASATTSTRASPAISPAPFSYNATLPINSSPIDDAPSPPLPTYSPPPAVHSQGARPLRKKTISKHDISEPTLISATSTFDTVDLPEGASLRNGMEEFAPPIPPINPRRRGAGIKLFGSFGRRPSMGAEDAARSTSTPDSFFHHDPLPEAFRARSGSNSPRPSGASPIISPASPQTMPTLGSPERLPARLPAIDGGMF